MIHLRGFEALLLCRASCCLKESHLSDKYCHYTVIYPFTIRASSLISSFMDLLTKEIALCCAHSRQSDKIPLFTFSLAVSHLASQFTSITCSHSPWTLGRVINKKPRVFACFVFLSFLSKEDSIVYGYLQSHLIQTTAWWHGKKDDSPIWNVQHLVCSYRFPAVSRRLCKCGLGQRKNLWWHLLFFLLGHKLKKFPDITGRFTMHLILLGN